MNKQIQFLEKRLVITQKMCNQAGDNIRKYKKANDKINTMMYIRIFNRQSDQKNKLIKQISELKTLNIVSHYCKRCGKRLDNTESIKTGYGPQCYQIKLEDWAQEKRIKQLHKKRTAHCTLSHFLFS